MICEGPGRLGGGRRYKPVLHRHYHRFLYRRWQVHLDEGKLKEALREKGDEVMRLFSNKST